MGDIAELNNIRIVLSHTSHPGNIGATARAMKTMGLKSLYLVNPKHFPDDQATARAAGAVDVLDNACVCASLDDALEGTTLAVAMTARRRELSYPPLTAREAAERIVEQAGAQKVAILFGTEMSGLTNAEIGKCQMLAHIPADPECSSLNLAAAVQVMAYELRTATAAGGPIAAPARDLAGFEDLERFYAHLEEVLREIEFIHPIYPKRMMQRLRRMFSRSQLEKDEVNILRGILTAIQKTN